MKHTSVYIDWVKQCKTKAENVIKWDQFIANAITIGIIEWDWNFPFYYWSPFFF